MTGISVKEREMNEQMRLLANLTYYLGALGMVLGVLLRWMGYGQAGFNVAALSAFACVLTAGLSRRTDFFEGLFLGAVAAIFLTMVFGPAQ